jgi:hypothetical protein
MQVTERTRFFLEPGTGGNEHAKTLSLAWALQEEAGGWCPSVMTWALERGGVRRKRFRAPGLVATEWIWATQSSMVGWLGYSSSVSFIFPFG